MKTIFCRHLKSTLSEKVTGKVYVDCVDDTLIVDIVHNYDNVFRYTLNDVAELLHTGLTSSNLAINIIKDYRHYIYKKFMK